MSPPKKVIKKPIVTNVRDSKEIKNKKEDQIDIPKLSLTLGVGWSIENFNYLKTISNEQIIDELYLMFGIPLEFKNNSNYVAFHLYIEFHLSSFQFASQFPDTSRAINIIAILSDYISLVPVFSSDSDFFSQWFQKTINQIQTLDFTPNESQTIINYLNKNIKANSHILHFILNKDVVQSIEKIGYKLFKTTATDPNDSQETRDALAAQKQKEFELQQQMIAQALKEKKEAEEKQKQTELVTAIEDILQENFAKIQLQIDLRNEQLFNHIQQLEEKIDGPIKNKK